jgi:quercetin dioxygenase-like cupin family protein
LKKLTFLLMALLIAGMMTCAAAPAPTGLLDSTPDEAVLASYDDWYAANAKPNDPKIIGKTIFSSPRSVVMLREAGKGTVAGSHFHATADEIVVVLGGSGEIFVNGVWTPVKAGDVHVNPRGVIHATRVTGDQDLKFISVFTPSLPAGGDANFTKEGEKVAIPVGLVDSNPKTAVLVNYDKWYAANAKPDEAKITGQTIFNSPRAIVIVREGGKNLAINHHFHAATDEIVIVLGGYGEMLLNGTWTPVKGGDVHVCPRGIVHSTRVFGDDDIRFISIFTPTLPPGGDTNFIQ